MTKISKRLEALANFVSKDDALVDVGCDHAYLSIYLMENALCKRVIASDINKNALDGAIYNVKRSNLDIPVVLSDGIKDVNLDGINTLVISGMGTSTMLHILDDQSSLKNINKIILQSNNNHEDLRRALNLKGYYLEDEVYTFDKGKWYVTSKFVKSSLKLSEKVIKYGLLNNDSYNRYCFIKEKEIYDLIPSSNKELKEKVKNKLDVLKEAIYGSK